MSQRVALFKEVVMSVRETIYKKALGILQMDYEDMTRDDGRVKEKEYCADSIETACYSAMAGGNYYWLIESCDCTSRLFDWYDKTTGLKYDGTPEDTTDYEERPRTFHGFTFGYTVPSNMYKFHLADGKKNIGYARKGKEIYFLQDVKSFDYIKNIIPELDEESWDYPAPFTDLIAAMLAVAIAPMVAPEGTFGQNATTKMQIAAAACSDINNAAYNEYRPNPKEYVQ
jgi:hypothetical protein